MSIDLSKLTPAPWEANGYMLYKPGGRSTDREEADTEFIALARNAFAGNQEALAWWEENRVKKDSLKEAFDAN